MSPREQRPPLADAPQEARLLTNARVAGILAEIADLLDIKGESSFKVSAYRRAADSVTRCPLEVVAAYRAGEPPELEGVGATISARLAELAATGRLVYHQDLREEVPPTLLSFLAIPGVGPRTAGEVWRTLGIATLPELEAAARTGQLRRVRGISARAEARIVEGIGELESRPPRRLRMDEAHALAQRMAAMVETLPEVRGVTPAGSVRRFRETVGDLDILVETDHPATVLRALRDLPVWDEQTTSAGGAARASWRLADGPQVDVMTMPAEEAGSHLLHFTGSAEHNVALRHRAREMGWSLSERGLVSLADKGARPLLFATEAELYDFLGLAQIPPELREGRGEVEAAASGALPRLVTISDLRGDCHSHSDWSDGREPLEVMVESARAVGREYQVLTDHSASLGVANGLSPARVQKQRVLVGELNERFAREDPGGFRLLHGTELEITADGHLDYEDDLLAALDVVVASLHTGRRQPRAQLMARYEVAMRSPHVDIISHPSGRKIGGRNELDLEWDAFYRLAAETGTLLEINGSPARLDLDEHRIRAAAEAGCHFVIVSDAHARSEWQHLAWGTAIARRAWLGPELVANTLPLGEFLALLREKPHRVGD